METTQEETKICSVCDRAIEVSKFRMHEIGCARMNYKCRECGELVAKSEKEEHEQEAHAPVKCQYCGFETSKAKFGNHEGTCELRPQNCPYCSELFKFEKFPDHVEKCGGKTAKCETCSRFVRNKDREFHITSGQCNDYQLEEKQKEELEQQKRYEELQRFQEEEEKKRLEGEKRRQERARLEAMQLADKPVQRPKVPSTRTGPSSQQSVPQVPGQINRRTSQPRAKVGVPASREQPQRQVITNKKVPSSGQRQPPSSNQPRVSGAGIGVSGTGIGVAPSTGARATGGTSRTYVKGKEERKDPVSRVNPPKIPKTLTRIQPAHVRPQQTQPIAQRMPQPVSQNPVSNVGRTQEDLDAEMIAQIMEEDENRMLAEKLQNEMYSGGAGAGAGGNAGGAGAGGDFGMGGGIDDGQGVRRGDRQRVQQLVGGDDEDEEPSADYLNMDIDEYGRHKPSRARGGAPVTRSRAQAQAARQQPVPVPDAEMEDWSGAGAGSHGGLGISGQGIGAGVSGGAENLDAELERAIAASMETHNHLGGGTMTEDEELARILEQSKQYQ